MRVFVTSISIFIMFAGCVSACSAKDSKNLQRTSDQIYSVDSCEFRIRDLVGGSFDIQFGSPTVTGIYKFPDSAGSMSDGFADFNPTFYCLDGASDDDVANQLSAKRVKGVWISLDTGTPFKLEKNLKEYEFVGVNWRALGYTYDDQLSKFRILNICLTKSGGLQALCINGPVMNLDHPNDDRLSALLKVLKSIKFKD